MDGRLKIEREVIEPKVGDLLYRYILATRKDVSAKWNKDKTDFTAYEHYDEIDLDKKLKRKIAAWIKVSGEAKQILSRIFEIFINEINSAELIDNMTVEAIVQEIKDTADPSPCITAFMHKVSTQVEKDKTLSSAKDVSGYFKGKLQSYLPNYANRAELSTAIAGIFDNFIKSIGSIIAKGNLYDGSSISKANLLRIIAERDLEQDILDDIEGSVVERKKRAPVKKAAAATKAAAPAVNATVTTTPATATPQTTTVSTPTQATTSLNDNADYDALLKA